MKFAYKDIMTKKLTDKIKVEEYRKPDESCKYPMDAAIAYLDEQYGPKKNTGFTELFFMIEGELVIKIDGKEDEILRKDDVFIMDKNVIHTIIGKKAKAFVVCNPPFYPEGCEMV